MTRWTDIDLPVLQAIRRLEDLGEVGTDTLAAEIGFGGDELGRSLRRLHEADFVAGINATGGGEVLYLLNIHLTERGLEAVGEWPSSSYEGLIADLQRAIDAAPDEESKSRLERLLKAVAGAGRDIVVSVLSEWAKKTAGL